MHSQPAIAFDGKPYANHKVNRMGTYARISSSTEHIKSARCSATSSTRIFCKTELSGSPSHRASAADFFLIYMRDDCGQRNALNVVASVSVVAIAIAIAIIMFVVICHYCCCHSMLSIPFVPFNSIQWISFTYTVHLHSSAHKSSADRVLVCCR